MRRLPIVWLSVPNQHVRIAAVKMHNVLLQLQVDECGIAARLVAKRAHSVAKSLMSSIMCRTVPAKSK